MPKQINQQNRSRPMTETKDKFWNFTALNADPEEPESAVLRIDGDIIDDGDLWLYEWFDEPASAPNAFRNELAKYADGDITVWVNSPGGSLVAAAGIYNALKECKGKVTVKIDGMAASAASVIAMAGDEILMSPLATMMIHEPLIADTVTGGHYADDYSKTAEVLAEIKETIINAYELKTGKSRDDISAMLKAITYMNAQSAIAEGFADGMLYSGTEGNPEVSKATNLSYAKILNFASNEMNRVVAVAEVIDKHQPKPGAATPLQAAPDNAQICHEEVKQMAVEITNAVNLKEQLPAVYTEVLNAGVAAERDRLKTFDELNGKVDPEYLASAKYEYGATAEKVLFNAMKEGKLVNSTYVVDALKDAENANKVPGTASDGTKTDEDAAILDRVQNTARKTLGIGGNK